MQKDLANCNNEKKLKHKDEKISMDSLIVITKRN